VGNKVHRMREPDVPKDGSCLDSGFELFLAKPDSQPFQNGRAEVREVDAAFEADLLYIPSG